MEQKKSRSFLSVIAALILLAGAFLFAKFIGLPAGGQITKELQFSVVVQVAGSFEIAIAPAELVLKKGESGTFSITNVPSGGFDSNISFTVGGLPEGSYSFSVNPVSAGQTTILTINSATLASNTTYVCSLHATDI